MKKLLCIVCTAALLLTGCGSNTTLRLGVAGLGGAYREFGDAYVRLVNGDDDKEQIEVKETAGSAASLRLLSQGYIQLTLAQADLAKDAWNGTGVFEGADLKQNYGAVAALYTEACQIVVRAEDGLTSIEDLQGKKVSIGEKESGTEQNAKQILAAYGLDEKLVDEVNLTYTEAASQLKSGEIDAFFLTAGVETTVIAELSHQLPIALLPVDGSGADRLKGSNASYVTYEIPAGTYEGQTEAVTTVGLQALLLASDSVPEETVRSMTQMLYDNNQALQLSLPVDLMTEEEEGTEGVSIPFHKGAAAYYESKDIQVETDK